MRKRTVLSLPADPASIEQTERMGTSAGMDRSIHLRLDVKELNRKFQEAGFDAVLARLACSAERESRELDHLAGDGFDD